MSTTIAEPAVLSAEERCDRCGAQALVRVVLPYGDLLFCGHHFTKHSPSLQTVAVRIDDYRDRL